MEEKKNDEHENDKKNIIAKKDKIINCLYTIILILNLTYTIFIISLIKIIKNLNFVETLFISTICGIIVGIIMSLIYRFIVKKN